MATNTDPDIQVMPVARDDEKKSVLAEVFSSTPSEPTRNGPLATLKETLRFRRTTTEQAPCQVYQTETPPPSGSGSVLTKIRRFLVFLGPGAVISVAYVDPDNYQTAISSGSEFQYKLLFMVLVSNLIAIYIQSLCVKLGTVTGMDLAQMNHRWLPRWLELIIYVIAEASIIATDLGQVIGTAIALNILIPKLPLPAACVISVVETLLVLLFYTPEGQLRRIRLFEIFVGLLVIVVFVTICVALSMVSASPRDVFRGYVPSREIFVDTGLYASCAILGGTLMPHALYVGTALSRARLHDFDTKNSLTPQDSPSSSSDTLSYRPSYRAIKACLNYSIAELSLTLFTVAIFVNSALVIISGAAFYRVPGADANGDIGGVVGGGADLDRRGAEEPAEFSDDLYDLYDLFSNTITPAAGTMFAMSLLFSGISAGIVSTMAGQIVMEGALNIRVSPFLRRLITRCVAIIPALVIALAVGQSGLSKAMVACNYLLAVALVPITFPIVYYTCFSKYMKVSTDDGTGTVDFKNHIVTAVVGWFLWLLVAVMDIATIVLVGLGITHDDG
ncbi:natural resistance-associated macrophage protein-domain-containing protein [Apodospora peruviana]|uniref:Natural resistance-associated macrophage protein-domain-containing protein n=1 Tax=Apodospora peruviana TaxID=516989 RepID=A0AAE0M169_9PEZI|nr:natural resistance-associated macrophage protein-domain-containing protein [Apodospora peruviana]